jgi:amino acid transporter
VATEIIGISIFACGMVIMTSGSRLVWSMSRDRRFPGHQLFGRVSLSLPTPVWANVLIMVGGIILILAIGHQESSRSR